MSIDRLIIEKRDDILDLAQKYGAVNIRVFGSAAKGGLEPESDVDFLVELEPGKSLFNLGALLEDLQDLLGRKVELVTPDSLHWYIREKVLSEALPL